MTHPLPKNWQKVKLGNLGDFKNGINKSKNDFGHGVPFINLMDIFGYSSISRKDFGLVNASVEEVTNYSLQKGDVLFVRSSVKPEGVGLATLIEEDMPNTVYSGFIIRFRDNGKVVHGFKKYCFHSPNFRKSLIAKSSISANTNINQEALCTLFVSLPPLPEQHRIVAVLETWDKAIERLERKIALKKNVKKGLIQKLLTGKVRLPGFSGEWKEMKLGDVCKIKKGTAFTKTSLVGGDIPVIAGGKQPAYYHNQSNRDGKTITISASGAYAGFVEYHERPIFASDCTTIQEDKIDIAYVYLCLKMNQNWIYNSLQTGGAQPHVYPKDLALIKIEIPLDRKEQEAITNVLLSAGQEIDLFKSKLQNLKEQKTYLLNHLITGRIRTPENMSLSS